MRRLTNARPASGTPAPEARATAPMINGGVAILALSAVFGIAALVPAREVSAQSAATTPGASVEDFHTRYRSAGGDGIRVVEIEGRVRFSADASRIEWMDEGSYLLVVTDDPGRHVRLRAEPDRDGRPAYRFDIDGRRNRAAGDIDRWLSGTLPVVFRELGHDADGRVRTAYEQGGADAVFRTLAAIGSDYSASLHYVAFFGRKDLADDEIIGALTRIGNDIDADQELATALLAAAAFYPERPAIRASFLACLDRFDSDVARSRFAQNLFGTDDVSGDTPPTMTASPGDC